MSPLPRTRSEGTCQFCVPIRHFLEMPIIIATVNGTANSMTTTHHVATKSMFFWDAAKRSSLLIADCLFGLNVRLNVNVPSLYDTNCPQSNQGSNQGRGAERRRIHTAKTSSSCRTVLAFTSAPSLPTQL
jgi:hypothetical protein